MSFFTGCSWAKWPEGVSVVIQVKVSCRFSFLLSPAVFFWLFFIPPQVILSSHFMSVLRFVATLFSSLGDFHTFSSYSVHLPSPRFPSSFILSFLFLFITHQLNFLSLFFTSDHISSLPLVLLFYLFLVSLFVSLQLLFFFSLALYPSFHKARLHWF